jgi:Na+-transporting NADH:ubiquinone oxidoreductase subunit F
MVEAFLAVLVVSAIAAALAAALVAAGRTLANYGECAITINDDRVLRVQGGASLLETLSRNKTFVPSACGGRGTCGYCKVTVLAGGGAMLPTEEPYLDAGERDAGVRLSCQVKVRNDLRIRIPERLFRVQEFTARCERIRQLTHDIREFRFSLMEPAAIAYTPGQYVQLKSPAYGSNEEVYRAYSISSDPADAKAVELVIRLVPGGICTTWCFEHLKEGDTVAFNGPYGEFHISDTQAPMIFIAGGSGMAPIKCMLHHMRNTPIRRDAVYFFGANRVNELFYLDEMRTSEQTLTNFRFVPVVRAPEPADNWTGETGLVTDAVRREIRNASGYEAYLCGGPGMIKASILVLTQLGMPQENIFYDSFG